MNETHYDMQRGTAPEARTEGQVSGDAVQTPYPPQTPYFLPSQGAPTYPPTYGAAYVPDYNGHTPARRVSAGTFLIPLGFMLLHLLVIFLVSNLFAAFMFLNALGLTLERVQEGLMRSQIYVMLVAMPVLIAIYLGAIYAMRRRGRPYVFFGRPRTGDSVRAALIGVGCLGAANLIMLLFSELATRSNVIKQAMDDYSVLSSNLSDQNIPIFIQILALVVVVPLAEELLFRGIILGELRRALPDWLSISLCGLLFALFHMNLIQSSYVLLAGLALSAVALWGRSIWLAILMHAIFNFFGSVALVLIGDNQTLLQLFQYFQLACVVLAIFLAIWSYIRRQSVPSPAEVR